MSSSAKALDQCSRVYFGSAAVKQPLKTYNGKLICVACQETCWNNNRMSDYFDDPEGVCCCNGRLESGCLFAPRHGEGATSDTLDQARSQLAAEYQNKVSSLTRLLVSDAVRYLSVATLLSIVRDGGAVFNACPPELRAVMQQCHEGVLTAEEAIGNVVRYFDSTFYLYAGNVSPVPVGEVVRSNSGSALEKCLAMQSLIHYTLKELVEVRTVFALTQDFYSMDVCFVQFRRLQSADWEWASSPTFTAVKSMTRPPTAAQKRRILFGVRSSGLLEDATSNEQAAYDASLFRQLMVEWNISHILSSRMLTAEVRQLIQEELQTVLTRTKDEMSSALRNEHRQWTSFTPSGDAKTAVQALIQFNKALSDKTVDNCSLVPLRVYPGEVRKVESFLNRVREQGSESPARKRERSDVPSQLLVPENVEALHLLGRCMRFWPEETKLVSLNLIELLPLMCNTWSMEETVGVLQEMDFFPTCSRKIASWSAGCQVACLRVVDTLYANTRDHVQLIRPSHVANVKELLHSVEGLVTRCSDVVLHQVALTLQQIAGSVAISSFDADANQKLLICDVVEAMWRLFANVAKDCHTLVGLFSLADVLDDLCADMLLEILAPEGRVLVTDTLELAYSKCPLKGFLNAKLRILELCS